MKLTRRARVWKADGLWRYWIKGPGITIHGARSSWRQAFDAALDELRYCS